MTITFPRDMPPCRISELSKFDLQHGVAINSVGGAVIAMELTAPLWIASFETEPLNWKQRAAVQAWWATLRGGVNTFYARDCFRKYPAAYGPAVLSMSRAAGGTFNGTCTITANGIVTVTLSGLPANYQFTAGDMIELARFGGALSLHQVVEAVVGNGSGIATVSIEPAALTDSTVPSSAVRLVEARCIMVPRPGSLDISVGLGKHSARFDAVQTLR